MWQNPNLDIGIILPQHHVDWIDIMTEKWLENTLPHFITLKQLSDWSNYFDFWLKIILESIRNIWKLCEIWMSWISISSSSYEVIFSVLLPRYKTKYIIILVYVHDFSFLAFMSQLNGISIDKLCFRHRVTEKAWGGS